MANHIKRNKEKTTITNLQKSAGKIIHSPSEIFINFYNQLYSTEKEPDTEDINYFLNNANLSQINNQQKINLETPLSENKFLAALKSMPNNKAPGPDCFPAEFYKHFWSILASLFIQMTNESKLNSKLPTTSNMATILLLLKPNKDPTLPSSYRPIYLINVDTKIFVRALRLEKVITFIRYSLRSNRFC